MQGIRYFLNNIKEDIEIKKCNNSMHSFKKHFHNEVSIGLVEKGCSKTEIYSNNYEITDRTFLIIPPAIPHRCNPYNYQQWKFRMLYINIEWFQSIFNAKSEKIKFSYMKLNEEMYLNIVNLFDSIEKQIIIDMEDESKLLTYIAMLNQGNNICTDRDIFRNFSLKKINRVKQYLNKDYLNNIKLSDLVKIANVSKYYLIRQFNYCYGLSPHQYLMNLRINQAKKLLKSNKNFVDIALESGFYDQSHFTKCFKEYTGVTPLEYIGCL